LAEARFDELVDGIVAGLPDEKKAQWALWENVRDTKDDLEEEHSGCRSELSTWENSNNACIVASAGVPIIVGVMTSMYNLSVWANLLDVVFPAGVAVIQGKVKKLTEKKEGYINVVPEYEILICDVLYAVKNNIYTDEVEKNYRDELTKLTEEVKRIRRL